MMDIHYPYCDNNFLIHGSEIIMVEPFLKIVFIYICTRSSLLHVGFL